MFSVAGIYSSFNTILLYFPTTTSAYLFPLTLWAIERILKDQKQFKSYLILCLGLAFALFGGNPEMVFYSMVTAIAYFMIRLYQTFTVRAYHEYVPLAGKLFLALMTGVLIAAIQWLPFLHYLRLSSAYLNRNVLDLPLNNLPAYLLLFNILPGIPGSMAAFSGIFEHFHTIIVFAYTSVSIFLLGIAGVCGLKKDRIVRAFASIAVMSLLLGFYIPYLHTVLIKLPGFDLGRNYYMLVFFGWSLIIIGSKAFEAFLDRTLKYKHLKEATAIAAGFIIVAGVWFAAATYPSLSHSLQKSVTSSLFASFILWFILTALTFGVLRIKHKQALVIIFGVLVYIQTALPMIFWEPVISPNYFYPNNKIFSLIHEQHGPPYRVTTLIGNNQPIAYATNINTFYNLEDIRNYDSLGINWYNSIFQYLHLGDALNLTNTKYLIEGKDFDLSSLTNDLQPIAEYHGYTLYKNLSAFNRAIIVYHYIVAESSQQALDLLHTYSGQLDKVAVVFKKDIQGMLPTVTAKGTYTIDFVKYTPGYIKLSCTTSQPGLFFISDTYFPGWHARVDGKKTKIIRADYAFQGLWLTQGTHTIELDYAPASFKYGALLSVIGILSLIGFFLIVFRKKKL